MNNYRIRKNRREEVPDSINVKDLNDEQVEMLEKLANFFRKQAKQRKEELGQPQELVFASWPLGVKGNLSREEIYDHL